MYAFSQEEINVGVIFFLEIDEKNDSKEVTIGDPFEIVFAANTPGALFSCSVYGPGEVTASLHHQDSSESKHVTRYLSYEMNSIVSINSIVLSTITHTKKDFVSNLFLHFSAEDGRIQLFKIDENTCNVVISQASKKDAGLWRGVIATSFRKVVKEYEHHNTNVTIIINGNFESIFS